MAPRVVFLAGMFRLGRSFQTCVYVAFVVLLFTGAAWMMAQSHRGEAEWESSLPLLMKVHGGAAMFTLLVLGALGPHIARAWCANKNRLSGAVLVALNAFLVATGYGLYYAGDEGLRGWLSRWHAWMGLGIFVVLPTHAIVGRLIVRSGHRRKSVAAEEAGPAKP
jgi:hypothetical protein